MRNTRGSILVTGGCGFIGSNLLGKLTARYPDSLIVVVDNLVYPVGLENISPDIRINPQFRFVKGSVTDQELMNSLVRDSDIVIHLAVETADPEQFLEVQLKGTQTILESIRKANITRLIFQSTSDIYGITDSPDLGEDSPVRATTLYAATKLGAEALVTAYYHTYGVPAVIIRPVSIYGPRQYPGWLISRFATLALRNEALPVMGDGTVLRDWIHVDDICQAFTAVIDCKRDISGEVFNLGTGKEYSVAEIAKEILEILNKPQSLITHLPPRPGDFPRQITKAMKAKEILGWEAKIEFYSGLRETVLWYKANQDWITKQLG